MPVQSSIVDLAECSEYRLALQGRPPRLVHATAVVSIALLVAAITWMAWTEASTVVRAGGRVRATTTPTRVFTGVRSSVEGRVVAVHFEPGDRVDEGGVLLKLDTARLDNEILRATRESRAGDEEIAKIDRLVRLSSDRFAAARAKTESEITVAEQRVQRAEQQRSTEIEVAELEVAAAKKRLAALRRLTDSGSASRRGLESAELDDARARAKLAAVSLPVDRGAVEVQQRAMALLQREHAVECEKLEMQRIAVGRARDVARRLLADLELQRERAVLRAPHAGIVTRGRVAVGDVLEPGRAVVEIVPNGGFTFEVAVPTEDVAHLRVGMPAQIRLDAFDYQRYGALRGVVRFISPDSTAIEASPELPGAAVGAAYLVKIELTERQLTRGPFSGEARLGMAGHAEIVTGTESLLALLLRRISGSISLG